MRRDPDEWSGVVMLVVSVGIGLPVLLGFLEPRIPLLLWALAFVGGFVAGYVAIATDHRPRRLVAYAVTMVLCWVVVLGAPEAGLLAILLVVVAALAPEIVGRRATAAVVAANAIVAALAQAQHASGWVAPLLAAGFYTLVQVAAVLSVHAIERERQLRRELARAHVELQAAGVALEQAARTAERLRISRELHDLLGHQLTALTLELEAARHRPGGGAQQHLERADQVARSLLADLRTAVSAERVAPAGNIADALERVGLDVPGLDVIVDVAPDVRVDEEQSVVLIRAMQEIVTNALRHADAHTLRVQVRSRDGAVVLRAVDDGVGAGEPVAGNGLTGMRERFVQAGGDVSFDGAHGFRVDGWLPAR